MTDRPWFAIRNFGDGESLALVHWKGAAIVVGALATGGGGLLGAWILLGRDAVALGVGGAILAASLAGLYLAIRGRTVDERG